MKGSLLLLLAAFFAISVNAQFLEDFNDGDITTGINWVGNTANFKVNSDHQLQLNTEGEGLSYLSASLGTAEILEWSFWIKCSFSPSDNNHAIFYLLADKSDLTMPLNGYFLKLGESGTMDAIELYRQTPTENILLARGEEGFLKGPFSIRLKVTRDDGHWEIWADSTGTAGFKLQATADDDFWQTYSTLGVVCKYTSSNSTKFRFDDIYAGQRIIDTKTPELIEAVFTNPYLIELQFDEPVDPEACSLISNYELIEDIGYPETAIRNPEDESSVILTFADKITEGQSYQLIIRGLKDLAGNRLDTSVNLVYYQVRQFDIVINEVMYDPEPPFGLPDCEYLELYNRTEHNVRLKDWILITGESEKELPVINVPAKAYCILTSTNCDSVFQAYGQAIGVPGFSLLNTGARVTLKNNEGAVIHQIDYNPGYLNNSLKEQGGWSLEQVDPDNFCGGLNNWAFSKSESGGTPGCINSVDDINTDNVDPVLRAIDVPDSVTVVLFFSEILDSINLRKCENYSIDHGIGKPVRALLEKLEYNRVKLIFGSPFIPDTIYTLGILSEVCDCAGNKLTANTYREFGLPCLADSGSLVINEILFDPKSAGTDFVEFYNRSKHVISLTGLMTGLKDEVTGELENACSLSVTGQIMLPGEYIVITQEPELLMTDYFTPNPGGFVKNQGFNALPNSGGHLVLCTRTGKILDEVTYNEDMHFSLLNSTKGVSLERIDFNSSSDIAVNWHSAAQNAGFATPAYQNSQYLQATVSDEMVKMEPEAISPDNDGYCDFLSIACNPSTAGCMITIKIYDSNGRIAKLLTANNLAGDTAIFNWDGTNDNHQIVSSGIYVVFTEILSVQGHVYRSKKPVVVTGH